jgi:hypothetical protein
MDAAARDYVEELDRRLSSARAVYVVGSAALGAYDPATSDLDVLAVVDAPLSARERDEIVARCSHAALPCPARKLELVVYTAEQVAAPARGQRWELNLNTGRDEPLHAGADPAAEPWHWFVLDLAQARDHAIVLHGPPAHQVIGSAPRELVLEAMGELLAWYAVHEPGEQLVLAAARAWRYASEGVFSPKREALAWACRSR